MVKRCGSVLAPAGMEPCSPRRVDRRRSLYDFEQTAAQAVANAFGYGIGSFAPASDRRSRSGPFETSANPDQRQVVIADWWPKDLGAEPHSVVFSASGERVAFPTAYHTVVYMANTQRGKLRNFEPPLSDTVLNKFRGDALLLTNVAFGPDDGKVAAGFGAGTVRLCQFGPEGVWRTVCAFPSRRVAHVAFSPEGRHVAAVVGDDVNIIRLPK